MSSPTERPLSPSGFRAVLSQAQPWGRLVAPLDRNGEPEESWGNPELQPVVTETTTCAMGVGRAERQGENTEWCALSQYPQEKKGNMGSRKVEIGWDGRAVGQDEIGHLVLFPLILVEIGQDGIHSKREQLMETLRCWLRETSDQGRREGKEFLMDSS